MDQELQPVQPVEAAPGKKVTRECILQLRDIHSRYTTGLTLLYERIKSNEEWWRLHNDEQERRAGTNQGADGGFVARSSWLNNVIISKHADGSDAYPEPTIQPREAADRQTAQELSQIVPCVLDLNGYRKVWSKAKWRKHKHGGAVQKVVWDQSKLNGLGDISIHCVNVLNLAWEPTVADIQDSPYFFQQEYVSREALRSRYPGVEITAAGAGTIPRFLADTEMPDTRDVCVVVECYYKVAVPTGIRGVSRNVLHYVVYVGDTVLYASEDDPKKTNGWYDHGMYPYVFDVLFPEEESAWGKGYIDEGKNPQTQIDLLNTAMVKNAMAGALPRWMTGSDSNFSVEDLLDLSKPVVKVTGSVDPNVLREIPHKSLEGNYLTLRESLIDEIRETTGNTDSATGNMGQATAGVAIAALQEASNKVSRDENDTSYTAFAEVCTLVIELIRQFYTMPRSFRITGQQGMDFVSFDNSKLVPQRLQGPGGTDGGLRKPEFDVIVGAQKASPYTRLAQNELALQFYDKGFFDPARAEQAMMCLDMMDFQGKQELMSKIQQQATIYRKMVEYAQLALQFAPPQMQEIIGADIAKTLGQDMAAPGTGTASITGGQTRQIAMARQRAQGNAVPTGG